MPDYIPLGTKVLLKKLPKPEPKTCGILLLNEPKEKFIAEVVDCGLEVKCLIFDFSEIERPLLTGDKVRYAPYSAHVIDESDPDYLIVDEKDIWCVVR